MRPSSTQRAAFPFAAIVGNEKAKLALMLLAVDPSLKGALIASGSGRAKSALARSFASLVGVHRVEVPLGVTEDRLLGGLDVELTLKAGKRRACAGLLSEASGGALFIDDINLLEDRLIHLVASALEQGATRVEREGVSAIFHSDFVLTGTCNPREGSVNAMLKDRLGLIVEAEPDSDSDDRAEIISRAMRFDHDPAGFISEFEAETQRIRSLIADGRKRLAGVCVRKDDIRRLAAAAARLGVEGNRADLFAVRAARANAALCGRDQATDEDLITAINLVLAPRARAMPAQKEQRPTIEDASDESNLQTQDVGASLEEMLIAAIDAQVPGSALDISLRGRRPSSGKRIEATGASGGRCVGIDARRSVATKIAVAATLRAAAPHQILRGREDRLRITRDDLRYKKFKRKAGVLFLFAIDASSSMAVNRFSQAKGAMMRLLGEAYIHRDKVAMVSFRGDDASLLLAPTRSVELGRRLIEALPAGGATPLAKGLVRAIEVAGIAREKDRMPTLLLLLTDGRANVSMRGDRDRAVIEEELRQLGVTLHHEKIETVVIDTRSKFISSGESQSLARSLGARYVYLPRADSDSIYTAVSKAAEGVRGEN